MPAQGNALGKGRNYHLALNGRDIENTHGPISILKRYCVDDDERYVWD
jgi:hypothetical protein